MNLNFNFTDSQLGKEIKDTLADILTRLTKLENNMWLTPEQVEVIKQERDVVKAAIASIQFSTEQVLQLLQQGQTAEAVTLIQEMQANSEQLVATTIVNTELAHRVDEINGEPVLVAPVDPAV